MLIGLDVTTRTVAGRDETWWRQGSSRSARLAQDIISNWLDLHPEREWFVPHDALAVAAAIRPDLLTFREATVTVETSAPGLLGKTTAEYGRGNASVALDVDVGRAREFMWGRISAPDA